MKKECQKKMLKILATQEPAQSVTQYLNCNELPILSILNFSMSKCSPALLTNQLKACKKQFSRQGVTFYFCYLNIFIISEALLNNSISFKKQLDVHLPLEKSQNRKTAFVVAISFGTQIAHNIYALTLTRPMISLLP